MRFFFGIIVGMFLTVGIAYVSDASTTGTTSAAAHTSVERQPMVNWDVVSRNWQSLSSGMRNTWKKLASS